MDYQEITLERDGHVARLTLNRPKAYNAITNRMMAELTDALDRINGDPDIRVCILSGAGKGFCAGGDLNEPIPDPVSDMLNTQFGPIVQAIHSGDTVFIGQIHGNVAGMSIGMALACDMMVMAEDAAIYLPFSRLGLIPDGAATWLLLQRLGHRKAMEVITLGQALSAQDCLEAGVANRIAKSDDIAAATDALAQEVAQAAPLASYAVKRLMRAMPAMDLQTGIAAEAHEQDILVKTKDAQTGRTAFFNREKPIFEGK